MIEFISEFLRKTDGIHIMRVPAGIQTFFQAAQDQRCAGDAGESLMSFFRDGIYFYFDAFPVS